MPRRLSSYFSGLSLALAFLFTLTTSASTSASAQATSAKAVASQPTFPAPHKNLTRISRHVPRVEPDTESVIINFTGTEGSYPGQKPSLGYLVYASDGSYYGTTDAGGTDGDGTIYKVDSSGTYTLLYTFTDGADGSGPEAGLIEGTDGNFYGTASTGGSYDYGSVFKITASGTFSTVYSFGAVDSDGQYPVGEVVEGLDGNLYGTTSAGGTESEGTVFRITPTGTLTTLYSFGTSDGDGSTPYGGLLQAADGNFYGTTQQGGTGGYGTVYKYAPGGSVTIVYNFTNATTDGGVPIAGLVQGTSGALYGTTEMGGSAGLGAAYSITTDGTFTLLHSFVGGVSDGKAPYSRLIQGSDGNLYGTADDGGANEYGTIFELTPSGTETQLYSFAGGDSDGGYPYASLVQAADGNFYGTTYDQGSSSDGTAFQLTVSPTLLGPVQLSVSPTTVAPGASFTLDFTVVNAYSDTLQQCYATNNAGDTTWAGVGSGSPTQQSETLTASSTVGTYNYTLTCGGMETGTVSLIVANATPTFGTLTFSPVNTVAYGTSEAITMSDTLNYTGSPAPTGAVTYTIDYNTFTATCTGTTSPLTCTATIPAATVHLANPGTYPGTPSFAGDSNYGATTGSTSNFTVTQGVPVWGTTNTISPASSEPQGTSQAITFSDTLSFLGATAPTGSVTFTLGTSSPQSFAATCTTGASPWTCSYTVPAATIAALPVGSYTGSWQITADSNYLAASQTGSNSFAITSATSSLTLTSSTSGTTTTGVASTVLTATLSPAVEGVTVTFTDTTTGASNTSTTDVNGVATFSATGTTAGENIGVASVPATANSTAATSNTVTVYFAGILVTTDLQHNFSGLGTVKGVTAEGTYDGSPVCNGSNGTAGSTCTNPYGIVVTNFTSSSQVIGFNFTNSAANAFSYVSNCPAGGLAVNATCNVAFYYNPPAGDGCAVASCGDDSSGYPEGTFEEATWSISAGSQITGIGDKNFDRSGPTSFPANLIGKALLAADGSLSATPLSLTFGPQAAGATSGTQDVTVTNNSSSTASITYSMPTSFFNVTNNCPASLAAGASCQLQIKYSDATPGTDTASIVLTPASGSTITISLSGTTANASAGLTLSTTQHNFGSVTDGTTETSGVGVTNNSTTTASLSFSFATGAGFTDSSNCGSTLAPGASCTVTVNYAPTATGNSTATVTFTSDEPILPGGTGSGSSYQDVATFTGTGVVGGTFTATTTGHNFGVTTIGSQATPYGVLLSNNTSVPLTLELGAGSYMGNTSGYTMATNCGATLAVNANCDIQFYYTPNSAGTTTVLFGVVAYNGSTGYPLYSGGTEDTNAGITLTGTGN
jgi:uncharacterized repeat protein (TIGR03803 family)